MMGRALRKKPDEAIILDHVNIIMNSDGTVNHGFPDDDHEWSLEGRKGMHEGAPSFDVKLCPAPCLASYRASLPKCPVCSNEKSVRPRKVEEIEGQLAEIQKQNSEKRAKARQVQAARDLPSIAAVALDRSYSAGWVAQRMKALGLKAVSFSEIHHAMHDARNKVLTV